MKTKRIIRIVTVALGAIAAAAAPASGASVVRLAGGDGEWRLEVNGAPFFVAGAGGSASKKALAEAGGNAFRTWGADHLGADLDEGLENGLMVMAGFWLGHAEHGFDYTDARALAATEREVLAKVREFKGHDALLCWALGNEMEMNNPHRKEMWEFIDRLAVQVKEIDPDHPVCTVVAEIPDATPREFDAYAPHLDFLGINTYGGCASIGERWRKAGMRRPYLVTEFGARGSWEGPADSRGTPLEQTSTEKGAFFAESYARGIAAERGRLCLGSFAFTWGWKVEATPTWHGMFLPGEIALGSTEAMREAWGGRPAGNRVPRIGRIECDKTETAGAGETIRASVAAEDPDGDPLEWRWTLVSEMADYGPVGASLPVPPGWDDAIVEGQGTPQVSVALPGGGSYRLYAHCFDGKGGAAYANVPLHGAGPEPKRVLRPVPMPLAVYDDGQGPWTPSGYMGNTRALKVDTACAEQPFEGRSCIRVDYLDHIGWAGIFWQDPPNDWGDRPGGVNLSNAATLVFRARGRDGGEKVTFFMGGLKDKAFGDTCVARLPDVVLKKEWTRYRIPLDGLDLSCVKSGFGFTLANDGEPFTFYLDDIRYVAE